MSTAQCIKIDVKNWPIESGNYRTGNPYHPVAVFLPQLGEAEKKLMEVAIEEGVAIVGVCYTANIGIEKVIMNIVSNPNIRWLIVAGRDNEGHRSGDAIIKLWRNGVDPKTRRIVGAEGASPYLPNIPIEAIERFRKQVTIIDMLGIDDPELLRKVIRGCIQEPWNAVEIEIKGVRYRLYDPGAYPEPPLLVNYRRIVEESGASIEALSPYLSVVRARTVGEAYPAILKVLELVGTEIIDERGSRTREVLNLVVHIEHPLDEPMLPPNIPREQADEYVEKFILSTDTHGFVYTYGQRLLAYPPCRGCSRSSVNQLKYIVNKLRECAASRRAVAVLWNPFIDCFEDEVPCITVIQMLVRGGRLHCTTYIRSNDMVRAWVFNAYAVAKIMDRVASELHVDIGTLTTVSISAHTYLD